MTSPEAIACLLAALASYVIGATPFGFLAGKMRGVDIREHGSGNIGATNVLRILGKGTGIPVFILDFIKGWVPVVVTRWLVEARGLSPEWPCLAAAVATVLGHNFTFWLGFKGGKGITTSAGVLLALLPWSLAAALSLWLILFYTTRYVAVASIGASVMVPASAIALYLWRGEPALHRAGFALILGVLGVWRHRSNIRRLLNGTENRFVRKSKPAPAAP